MMKKTIVTSTLALLLSVSLYGQWTKMPNLPKNVISLHVSNNNLLAGTDTGIYYTDNSGNSWGKAIGITTTAKSIAQDGTKLLVASYEQLFQSANNGYSWTSMPTVYSFQDVNTVVLSGSNYVIGMNGTGVWYSTDKGLTWVSSNTSWQGRNTDIVRKTGFMMASFQGSGYLQTSNDNGVTWYGAAGNGIKVGQSSSFQDIYCLGVKNDSILIAGTKNTGTSSQYDGVYFSYDDGKNWTRKINGISTTAINSLAVIGNVIFAGTNGGGVFYSADEGLNWVALNTGLSNLTINKLYISGSTLYAGVSTGVFNIDICNLLKNNASLEAIGATTIQSGDSVELRANTGGIQYQWFVNNTQISSSNKPVLYAKEQGNYKAVISYSATCLDTTKSIAVVVNGTNGMRDKERQESHLKVYPNPSSGTVAFELTTPTFSEPAEILIYDVAGSLLKTLPVFTKQTQLTTDDWEAGMYYAVLRSKTISSQAQAFIVVK